MGSDHLGEEKLVQLLQTFVRYPSQQTDLQEKDPEVKAFIRECVEPLLGDLEADISYDEMGNLILDAGSRSSGRSLMFVAYAMTHPAANMEDPFAATLIDTPDGPAVRGRGVAEQKTALAAAIGAISDALSNGSLPGRLILALTTAGETGRHDAVESVMRQIGDYPDQVVVCVGTGQRIAVGNKGRVDFNIRINGKSCHSSAPWKGVNSIAGARRVIEWHEAYDPGIEPHPVFGPATLTPTAIESAPRATHTVPNLVQVTFDRRLLPGEDPEETYWTIIEQIRLEEPWTVESSRGPVMYPNELSTDAHFYRCLETAFSDSGLEVPEPLYCDFALDAGYFGRKGVEAVMLGPGDIDQFHSDEEHVLVSDLSDMAKVYRHLIDRALTPA